MPLFDYKCEQCGEKIEDIMEAWVAKPALRDCPKCGSEKSAMRLDIYQTWFSLFGVNWSHTSANCNNFKV